MACEHRDVPKTNWRVGDRYQCADCDAVAVCYFAADDGSYSVKWGWRVWGEDG